MGELAVGVLLVAFGAAVGGFVAANAMKHPTQCSGRGPDKHHSDRCGADDRISAGRSYKYYLDFTGDEICEQSGGDDRRSLLRHHRAVKERADRAASALRSGRLGRRSNQSGLFGSVSPNHAAQLAALAAASPPAIAKTTSTLATIYPTLPGLDSPEVLSAAANVAPLIATAERYMNQNCHDGIEALPEL